MKQILFNIWYGLQYIAHCICKLIYYIMLILSLPIILILAYYILQILFFAGIEIYGYKIPYIGVLIILLFVLTPTIIGIIIFFSGMKEYIDKKNEQRLLGKETTALPNHQKHLLPTQKGSKK